jgi:hypothetical protein
VSVTSCCYSPPAAADSAFFLIFSAKAAASLQNKYDKQENDSYTFYFERPNTLLLALGTDQMAQ